jgi:hypothetical protein
MLNFTPSPWFTVSGTKCLVYGWLIELLKASMKPTQLAPAGQLNVGCRWCATAQDSMPARV